MVGSAWASEAAFTSYTYGARDFGPVRHRQLALTFVHKIRVLRARHEASSHRHLDAGRAGKSPLFLLAACLSNASHSSRFATASLELEVTMQLRASYPPEVEDPDTAQVNFAFVELTLHLNKKVSTTGSVLLPSPLLPSCSSCSKGYRWQA